MNTRELVLLAAAAVSILLAACAVLYYRRMTGRTLAKMNRMLDEAIAGRFKETTFDESALSELEAKLSRHLSQYAADSESLREEKDKIKELISDISHQTKTPISNLLLYSQLLGERELPGDCADCVKALTAQTEKLAFLIDALVKTSRLEAGIITVTPRDESVQNLLDAVTEQIKPKADAKRIVLNVANTRAVARFDLKWTTEALYNILDNAVKYTPEECKITVHAVTYELFCRIDIIDEGIGIAEEEQNRIFARFYRSKAVAGQEGVGIGLFLSREILSAQGGYIKVRSQAGSGSTFSVFLPIAR
jgi:signal transduction histidine kinase